MINIQYLYDSLATRASVIITLRYRQFSDLSRADRMVSTLVASVPNGCFCDGAVWHYQLLK